MADTTLRDLEIRHLAALRAVAAERSFGRAAERLGYTQSAVSQQIASLERIVGQPVFDRPGGPRPVELTATGALLLEHAHAILDRLDTAESDLVAFKAGVAGVLAVGTFQSVSVRILPEVLRRFRTDRPHVEVRLVETDEQQELLDGLASRTLDAAFLVEPFPADDLEVVRLCEDPFVVLSPPGGEAVASGEGFVPAPSLSGLPLISQHDSACQRLIDGGLRRAGVDLNVVFRSNDNTAVQAMVRAGFGHAVMPALAIDAADPGVVIRRLDPQIRPRIICLAHPATRALPPALAVFREVAVAVCAGLASESDLLAAAPSV